MTEGKKPDCCYPPSTADHLGTVVSAADSGANGSLICCFTTVMAVVDHIGDAVIAAATVLAVILTDAVLV